MSEPGRQALYPATVTDFGHTQGSSSLLESMAEEPQQQRDNRAARKQQLNGQIRAGVPCELNQCVHDEGMLSAVRIPLISDHDRFVARLFRVQVNEAGARELGAWARRQQINLMSEVRHVGTRSLPALRQPRG